ncbi:hypothetical protein Bca52824_064322 [Brassica carinata]|uniref:Uncharacterized protein n=1 Tax=Brassica carinata TaxID=52824 RepID=A0A8X7QGJ1_BRACI|nr:hypothetical protein Bca52824_064322 [Brassica carinata]
METISGGRNVGSSSGGTGSLCNSCIVVMAGRWKMFDNGSWDFKIDNDRMGRAVDSSRIRGAEELKTCILVAGFSVEIATDKDFRISKRFTGGQIRQSLRNIKRKCWRRNDISKVERVIRVQMNAPVRPPDEDVAFLMEVQQIEERYKRNSQSGGMVATSKDQDKSGETLDDGSGANSENCEQEKGNVCGDDLAVDNRENKEGKVEEGGAVKTASDNLPQQICLIEDTRTLSVEQVSVENGNNGGAQEDVAAEDEGDDSDYDYNGWHDYCRNDCVTDDDNDFVEGPGKGRSGGQSGGKGIRRPGGIGGTGAAKSACGKKQRSRGGGYISKNNDSSVEITDLARDLGSPSRLDTYNRDRDNDDDAVVDTPIPQPPHFGVKKY